MTTGLLSLVLATAGATATSNRTVSCRIAWTFCAVLLEDRPSAKILDALLSSAVLRLLLLTLISILPRSTAPLTYLTTKTTRAQL